MDIKETMDSIKATTVEINGHVIEFDFLDADTVDRYYEAQDLLIKRGKKFRDNPNPDFAENLREQCRTVEEYFDMIFGAGTGDTIFDGMHGNLRAHLKAVEQLVDAVKASGKEINDMNNRNAQRMVAQAKKNNAQNFRNYAAQHGGRNGGKKRH